MKIAIGFNYFDNLNNIKRAMTSFKDADEIVAIYGKYTEYDDDPTKYDKSWEYVESFPKTVSKAYIAPQHNKRTMYLQETTSDVLIVVDSDEWLTGDWGKFRHSLQRSLESHPNVSVFGIKANNGSYYPRVFRNPNNFKYHQSHCTVNEKGHGIYHLDPHRAELYHVDGLTLNHSKDLRTVSQRLKQYNYHKIKKINESKVRDKYG